MNRIAFALFPLLLVALAVPAWAGSGIQGRVAWRTELVPGITIRAYHSLADLKAGRPVAEAPATALDGTYRIDLPPGSYFLTARDFDGAPQPGDHFCYYSGSPVQVRSGGYTNVGFNLIKVPREAPPRPAGYTGIEGDISFQGEPLERVYLYVYKDPKGGFKGPGYTILPVEKGHFRLRLPPGEYWLLARKRAKGGRFGPIEIGDYFNYYYGNPVRVAAGQVRDIQLETITRLSMLEEGPAPPFRGVRGVIIGPDGAPAAGLHVFAYRAPEMTGTPAFFSPPSGPSGHFELSLPGNGPYYLLVREAFGGPAGEGELYGKYEGSNGHALTLAGEQAVKEISIHVEKTLSR